MGHRGALGIGAAALSLLSSGCSLAMRGPPRPVVAPDVPAECTSSFLAPALDALCVPAAGMTGLMVAFGSSSDADAEAALGVAAGAMATCAVSAVVGVFRAARCTHFKNVNAACVGGDLASCSALSPGWSPSVARWVERPPPPAALAPAPPPHAAPPISARSASASPAAAPLTFVPRAPPPRFTAGVRLGYGVPMGEIRGDMPLGDLADGRVPMRLDATYALSPRAAVGAYLAMDKGRLDAGAQRTCDAVGAPCSIDDWHLGIQGEYALRPAPARLVPWIGAAIGMERLSLEYGGGPGSDFEGPEIALQGGARYRVGRAGWVGPYLQLSVGEYGSLNGRELGGPPSAHGWVDAGVRAELGL